MKTTKEIFEPYHDFISTVYKVERELTKSIDIITSVKSLEAYELYEENGGRSALWLYVRDILNDIRTHFGLENVCNNEHEAEALKPKLEKYRKLYHDKLRGATTFHMSPYAKKLNKVK